MEGFGEGNLKPRDPLGGLRCIEENNIKMYLLKNLSGKS
jgi:hypothetical protein